MEHHLGTENTPSIALQAQHIRYHLQARETEIGMLPAGNERHYQLCLAQLVKLLAWIG